MFHPIRIKMLRKRKSFKQHQKSER